LRPIISVTAREALPTNLAAAHLMVLAERAVDGQPRWPPKP
jgi:hypothetical protein